MSLSSAGIGHVCPAPQAHPYLTAQESELRKYRSDDHSSAQHPSWLPVSLGKGHTGHHIRQAPPTWPCPVLLRPRLSLCLLLSS